MTPRAQAAAQIDTGLSPTALAVEQQVSDRWLHGRQQPRISPFEFRHAWMFVDSVRGGDDTRRLYITRGRPENGRDSAVIVLGPTGLVERLHVGLVGSERGVPIAETRLWDLVPTFPHRTPRVGLRWTDTIAHVALDGPFRQSLRGSRVSRIVADTVMPGGSREGCPAPQLLMRLARAVILGGTRA